MSQENVEIVRRVTAAFNQGGFSSEAALGLFHEEVVFEEPPEQPGAAVGHGRGALQRMFAGFDGAWEEHRTEVEEIRSIDDDRVLMLSTEHFRGRDKLEITQPCATIFTIRDSKIGRMQPFWDRTNAFAVAGIES